MNAFKGNTFVYYWLPLLSWMMIIFVLSHQDGPTSAALSDWVKDLIKTVLSYLGFVSENKGGMGWGWLLRKIAHATEYAILAVLSVRVFYLYQERSKALIYSLCLCIVYAMLDEFHQSFIPGRGPSLRDVGIDSLGAGIALGILQKFFSPEVSMQVEDPMEKA
ncbi:MAG: VanZ family protein [Bacteroidota bacterium]